MKRSIAFLLAAALLACAPAPAPVPSVAGAEKLVADLYADHDAGRSPFFQTEDRARVDRYFEPDLAAAIWKDAVDAQGEVGALGFDPLYDAQDVEIKNLAVKAGPPAGSSASVVVTFDNFGKKQEIRYSLASTAAGWKIADITYGDGRTLRAAYRSGP